MPTSHFIDHIDRNMVRVLACKSECERLQAGFRMWTAARSVTRAAVLADHGDWSKERVDREVAVRLSKGLVARVAS